MVELDSPVGGDVQNAEDLSVIPLDWKSVIEIARQESPPLDRDARVWE